MMTTPRFPFTPYPNGWFLLAYSDELPPAGVLALTYFGSDLVLYRGEDGAAYVLDAYCPHMGAHIGYGGSVCGNVIRCPFHGWSFNGAGQCVGIPDILKIPPKARVRSWPVREHDGVIFIYHHADGTPPAYEPMRKPYYNDPLWGDEYRFRWRVRTHPQEAVENFIDRGHFRWIHQWNINLECQILDNQGPFMNTLTKSALSVDGTEAVPMSARGCSMGLGWVDSHLDTGFVFHTVDTFTPIDGTYVDIRTSVRFLKTAETSDPEREALLAQDVKANIEADIKILERKRYVAAPMLCESDGPILAFRRWAKQFYETASPS